ncbi:hypothetical protein [Lacticigenium naphthae]|uniref:hypothetical protein n=1 Tax=Lacticigenium naphthae TaxID=515351 RepID=UPI00041B5175|nr:hypothetical protein [Lacticigenium naphthae]
MSDWKNNLSQKISVTVAFLFMITMNGLANALPINGLSTGEVSGSFPNLFEPAGITFSIWGVIYLTLFAFVLYQWKDFTRTNSAIRMNTVKLIRYLFIFSSIVNGLWILTWHYKILWLSLILMGSLLVSLISILRLIPVEKLTIKEKIVVQLPFSLYFGWITVATIANVTAYLVQIDWQRWGISEVIWTVLILLVGFLIAASTAFINKDIIYLSAVIWGYTGILIKHIGEEGWNGDYPVIVFTVSASIILFIGVEVMIFIRNKKKSI